MINPFSVRSRMKRIYSLPKEIYTNRFFIDLCSGFSFRLGEKNSGKEFYAFEPKDCRWPKLLMNEEDYGPRYYNLTYRIGKLIDETAYNLLLFGKAYVCIEPHYKTGVYEGGKECKVLASVNIVGIKGFMKRCSHSDIVFYRMSTDGAVREIHMQRNQLIEFDIRELGYGKRYFIKKLKQLRKYDITNSAAFMTPGQADGYDFSVHFRKNKLCELKVFKDIGWSLNTDELSNSYFLYRYIQEDKLRRRILKYILDKLNCGFESFLGEPGGKLVAYVKDRNYDQLWRDYTDGKITGTELTDCLFK